MFAARCINYEMRGGGGGLHVFANLNPKYDIITTMMRSYYTMEPPSADPFGI